MLNLGDMLLVQVFKHYFEELEEESLRDNFVVVVSKITWAFASSRAMIIPSTENCVLML